MVAIESNSNHRAYALSSFAATLGFSISFVVLFFWLSHNAIVQSVFPNISPLVALGFLLYGTAYFLLRRNATRSVGQIIVLVVLGATFISSFHGFINTTNDIDLLFLSAPADTPRFFSLSTALMLIFVGVALLLTDSLLKERMKWAQLSLLVTIIIAGIAILGYLYNEQIFYSSIIGAPVSFTTALLALLIGVAVMHSTSHEGLLKIIASSTSGGLFIRRLLPLIIVIPHIIGLFFVNITRNGSFQIAAATAGSVIVCEVLLIAALWWTARNIDHSESEREQFAKTLRESEARYRVLFEQSTDIILITDESGRYVDANPQAEKLLGYSREELLNFTVGDLSAKEDRLIAAENFKQSKQDGHMFGEAVIRHKNGRHIIIEFAATRIAPGMYQSVLHDITAYKQVEGNLRYALEKEQELNEMKSRFVSMVSHEFRTPLSIIRTSSDILDRYNHKLNDGQRKEYFTNVQTQVTHMVQLLEDVLTISKSSTVGVEFAPEYTELNAMCRQIIDEFQMTTSTHMIIYKSTQEVIAANVDRKLFRQALTNLLSNALKYSPDKDRIIVDLDCKSGTVCLNVQDFGIGIPVEDQGRLFEHFHRARNVGDIFGTGLGLAIVKQAVEAHGGAINFSCAEGTTFTVTLPQPAPTISDIQPVLELHPTDLY